MSPPGQPQLCISLLYIKPNRQKRRVHLYPPSVLQDFHLCWPCRLPDILQTRTYQGPPPSLDHSRTITQPNTTLHAFIPTTVDGPKLLLRTPAGMARERLQFVGEWDLGPSTPRQQPLALHYTINTHCPTGCAPGFAFTCGTSSAPCPRIELEAIHASTHSL
ncbi:hypothetical protein CONLIGDRAFT_226369 [Coniochaeta ligniaria NRRL 30616]|uniref:Uncharacterized protein n=1 Tax=Coniochaeta ligniaria NRRL 30616 TaxID=1408157 RepID=A0A1J7J496_9PEZI|nr:hypothetical protein CONLIGDRAFT_226369 [Coniochaeta ligniaria NRRL 30616]